MKVATLRTGGSTSAARVEGDALVLLPFADVGALLEAPGDWQENAAASGEEVDLADADFAPLVPRPEKIFAIGLNYQSHAAEARKELPEYPPVFSMYWRALIGANDDLVLPPVSDMVDWESELGVVVGSTLRYGDRDEGRAAIAGYTVVNDVSMREWQRRSTQFVQGKTFEASTPVGPYLVSPDEVGHAADLRIGCTVDGVTMQDASTSQLHKKPDELVAYLSQIITLVPGDLIATGTPGGVGGARKPPIYLRDGQELRTSIEGVGEQRNRCIAAPRDGTP